MEENRSTVTKMERHAREIIQESGQGGSLENKDIVLKLATISKTLNMKQVHLAKLDDEILGICHIDEI